jgi:REP element-mobilizing transposase RayT
VIARGNARERIARDDIDRRYFLHLLGHVVARFSWLCHAYCVMDNHYHLVVETPLPNLPSGMRQLNGRYAQAFNARYDRSGHVFQARYRSILVEKESYLLTVCRYVVLNPVRAGVCPHPAEWVWSSYRATAGLEEADPLLTTDWLLAQFAPTRGLAQRRYRKFVSEADSNALGRSVQGERLGDSALLEETFGYKAPLPEIPRVQVEPSPPSLETIFAAQQTPIATAYRRYGYTLREIAVHLGCSYSTVSRRLRREEEAIAA